MSTETQVYAVADGGNGLSLHSKHSFLTFICLDRPHLKQHLYEAQRQLVLGLSVEWVSDKLHLISAGDVRHVIRILKRYCGQGRSVLLIYLLSKHFDAVDYDYFRAKVYLSVQERLKALIVIFLKTLENSRGWHPDTINPCWLEANCWANDWWEAGANNQ